MEEFREVGRNRLRSRESNMDAVLFTCYQCHYNTAHFTNYKLHLAQHNRELTRFNSDLFKYVTPETIEISSNSTDDNDSKQSTYLQNQSADDIDHQDYTMTNEGDHTRQAATRDKPFACDRCSYKSWTKCKVERHMKRHTGEKLYKCDECEYRAAERTSVKFHMEQHHPEVKQQNGMYTANGAEGASHGNIQWTDEKLFACRLCSYKSPQECNVKRHMKAHKNDKEYKEYKCDQCIYTASQPHHLTEHVAVHHSGEEVYTCTECPFTTTRVCALKNHTKTHFPEDSDTDHETGLVQRLPDVNQYACNLCSYRSTEKHNVLRHTAVHTRKKPYRCDQCSYQTSQRSNLKAHKMTHRAVRKDFRKERAERIHPTLGRKLFTCSKCTYKSTVELHVKKHMKLHTGTAYVGEGTFKCDQCPYRATEKARLKTHKYCHSEEKPFACSQCEFKSARLCILKKHEKKRHEAPDSAESKTKETVDSTNLSVLKTDSKEKPFGCSLCGFMSAYKTTIQRHFKIHTGEKPYSCDLCEYRAAEKQSLDMHMRKHGKPRARLSTLSNSESPRNIGDTKTFDCDQCEYSSAQLINVQKHKTYHIGNRPNKCDKCSYNTTLHCHLVKHMKIHGQKTPSSKPHAFGKMESNQRGSYVENKNDVLDQTDFQGATQFVVPRDNTLTEVNIFGRMDSGIKTEKDLEGTVTPASNKYSCSACTFIAAEPGELQLHFQIHIK